MRPILRLAFYTLCSIFSLAAYAQPSCGTLCTGGCSPTPNAQGAPVACGTTSLNFAGSTAVGGTFTPPGFCGTIENNQWIGFVASAPDIVLTLQPLGCTDGNGLQIAVYEYNCQSQEVGTQLDCVSTGVVETYMISLNALCVNNTYMVMIDGFGGDVCSFVLTAQSSVPVPPPLVFTSAPVGQDVYCPGQTHTYTVDPLSTGSACDDNGGIYYNWDVSGPASVISGQGTPTVDILYENGTSGPDIVLISVSAQTLCSSGTGPPLVVNEFFQVPIPEPLEYCLGESVTFEGVLFSNVVAGQPLEVTYTNSIGCDSIVSALPIPLPFSITDLGTVELCGNETFEAGGQTFTSADAGLQEVDLENAAFNGCDSTLVFAIVPDTLTADIQASAPAFDCNTTTVTLDGSGSSSDVSYEWTDGTGAVISTAVAIDVTMPGVYTLTVTSNSNSVCFDAVDISLVDNSGTTNPPTVSGPDEVCSGDAATYTIANDPDINSIVWTLPSGIGFTGQSTTSINVNWGSASGDVIAEITTDCGTASDTLSVTVNDVPDATTISGGTTVCLDDTESYSIPAPATGETITWTVPGPATFTGQGTADISVVWGNNSTGGTISVVLTNTCGDSDPAELTVTVENPPAMPDLSGATSVCDGDTETYSSPAVSGAVDYTWTLPDGSTQTTTDPSLDIDWSTVSGGQLCLQANNDCGDAQDCINVTVNSAPEGTLSDPNAPTFVCANSNETVTLQIALTGVSPWTVVYAQDGTDQAPLTVNSSPFQFNVNGAGTYTLTSVSNASGCTGIVNGTVTVIEVAQPTAGFGMDLVICEGSAVPDSLELNLTGTPEWTIEYTIDNVAQAPLTVTALPFKLAVTEPGVYAVTSVTDGSGCSNTGDGNTATVTENTLLTVADLDTECNGINTAYTVSFTISGGDPGTYAVNGDPGTLSGNTFTSDPIPSGTAYSFTVSDGNGCNVVTIEDTDGITCDCESAVGSMEAGPLELCGDGPLSAVYDATGETFDANDALIFVLHDNPGITIGNVLAESNSPSFSFDATNMTYGTTYYISAVVGDAVGSSVDFTGACTQVAQGTPIVFFEEPTATLSGNAAVCTGDDAELTIDFTGVAPFSITYEDAAGTATMVNGIMTATGYVLVIPAPAASTTITLTTVSDANCPGTASGSTAITVATAPTFSDLDVVCNSTSTGYTVSFEISGGDPASYSVTGGAGTITGNTFTSAVIPTSDGFAFVLTDANDCDPVTIEQTQVVCDCLSEVGTVSQDPITQCVGTPATYTLGYDATNENLDGDDAFEYVLHTAPAANVTAANFVARSADGQFVYDPTTMSFGTTYFISPVVGNEVPAGSGMVDFDNDPCVAIASGTPITFYENPTATLTGDQDLCVGESATLAIALTGEPPFTITLNDGTVDTVFTGVGGASLVYTVYPQADVTYTLVSVDNDNCPGTVSGSAAITVNEAPQYSNVQVVCNPTSTAYTVSFDISGGDPATYMVSGDAGSITGSTFTSAPITPTAGYTFVLTDANDCEPQTVTQPTVVCDCLTEVGTTDQTLIETCGDGPAAAVLYDDTDENLDGDDVAEFILHSAPADDVTAANFIARNTSGEFSFMAGMTYGTTYFVSAVIGNELPAGSGEVDYLNDPCVQVSLGTPVVFYELPTATLSADQEICTGAAATLTVDFQGPAPFTITINDGTADTIITDIATSSFDYAVFPTIDTDYTLTAVSSANCPGTATGTVTVTVNEAPNYTGLSVVCNGTGTAYTVSFDITGGDPASYSVTGGVGTLTGSTFTSDPIPADDGFAFTLDDANNCAPVVIEQPVVSCDCLTAVGTTDQTPLELCGDGPTGAAVYDATDEFLDTDDAFEYILHTAPADDVTAANFVARSADGNFTFDAGSMSYGTTYYISAVAGNEGTPAGTVNYLSDPCVQVSAGTPVTFYAIPTAILSGTAAICDDQSTATLNVVSSTDDLPYTIVINDGNADSTYTLNSLTTDITVFPTATTTYTLVSVASAQCPGTVNGSATITVNDAPTATNLEIESNTTNTFYNICFDIVGGDPSSYVVTGLTGTISGGQFCSDDIPCGTIDYAFSVNDANGCGPTDYSGQYVCNCTSEVGVMTGDALALCAPAEATTSYDGADEFLDGNDARQFVLHDGSGNVLGNVIAVSNDPSFAYPAGAVDFGATYYISAVVGDADGSGDVLLTGDPCLQVAAGTPVVWSEVPTATLDASIIICEGSDATITVVLSGGSGNYLLDFGTGTPVSYSGTTYTATFTPSADTTYQLLSVEDAVSGCSNTLNLDTGTEVTDELSAGTPLSAAAFCAGSGTMIELADLLENADQGGTWSVDAGSPGTAFNAAAGTVDGNGLAAGTYSFSYSIGGSGGCPLDESSVSFTVNPQPTADAGTAGTLTCDTPEVTIGGSNTSGGAFAYEWTLNGNVVAETPTFTAMQAGVYTLTVFDSVTGCSDSDEVEVEENVDGPLPNILVSPISCFGQQDGFITINDITGGVPPYVCSFNGGEFTQAKQFGGLGPGAYTITIQDSEGCQTTVSADITEPQELQVTLVGNFMSEDNSILWGDSVELSIQTTVDYDSLTSVQWTPPLFVECDTCQSNTVMPTETTQYGVTVQQGECVDSDFILVTVKRDIPIFIPSAFSPNGEGNGANEIFFVQGDANIIQQINSFRVYNRWGEPVIQFFGVPINDPTFGWDGTFRGQMMNPAVFVYAIEVLLIDGTVELFEGDVTLMR